MKLNINLNQIDFDQAKDNTVHHISIEAVQQFELDILLPYGYPFEMLKYLVEGYLKNNIKNIIKLYPEAPSQFYRVNSLDSDETRFIELEEDCSPLQLELDIEED